MKLILVIVVLGAIAFIYLSMRGRRTAGDTRSTAETNPRLSNTSKFHAVSLIAGRNPCTEARSIEGERYLANNAPRLPLPGCDVADCRCRFAHHEDRRGGDDRRNPYPSPIGLDERAHKKDQRKDADRRRNPPNAF